MRRYSLFQKMLAMLLSIVLVVGLVPTYAVAADNPYHVHLSNRVSDDSTMNGWKDYFGPDKHSTEFAGAVWTDKSVLTSADAFLTNDITMLDAEHNFLVALSAMAANQEIVGYASNPLDVMLVLDVSGSMKDNNKDAGMVDAANLAMDAILSAGINNRVGIVLYSGASKTGTAQADTATVLMPLDHYTTTATDTVAVTSANGAATNKTIGKYLNISSHEVSVNNQVRNSSNRSVSGSKKFVGGTYIQTGIYHAWN